MTMTSAPASSESSAAARAHPGGAADDEHALAVEAECIELRHVGAPVVLCGGGGWRCAQATTPRTLRSTIVSQSRPSSARISSPCSLNSGARPGAAGSLVVLHGRGHQLERRAAGGVAVLEVAVGDRLRVDGGLERVLHDRPLARRTRRAARATRRAWPWRTPRRGSRSASALFRAASPGRRSARRWPARAGRWRRTASASTCRPGGR